ncbi:Ig-like domain-containing protein [Caulobacter sp. D4A]|nr:Ig-like domain-containing protein [Caulobacter sp. D4A]
MRGVGGLGLAGLMVSSFAAGAVAQTSTGVLYRYDAAGRVVAVLYPNGAAVAYAYDKAGNRTQLSASPASTAPNALPISASAVFNTPTPIALAPAGNYTSLAIVSAPTKGVVSLGGEVATYTPNAGYIGVDSFSYRAIGPGGQSAPAVVSVTVATPSAPGARAVTASVAYNTPKQITLYPTGAYSQLQVVAAPTKGAASISGVTATYSPSSGSYGADSFTYKAVGPGGESRPAVVSVTISTPPAPTPSDLNFALAYNSTVNIFIPADAGTSLYVSQPSLGKLAAWTWANGGWNSLYTANTGVSGADAFAYNLTNVGGTSANRRVDITIAAPTPPTVAAVSATTSYNTLKAITLSPSGLYTTLAIGAQPSHGSVTLAGTTANYTPTNGYYGADAFTYTATGPGGTSAAATVSLTVTAPAAPTVAAMSASTAYNTPKAITLAPSGVYASLSASAPAHGTVSISGTTATYTPTSDYYGADSFTYTATGPGGTSAAATVSLTVATPAAPTVAAVSTSTAYNTAKAIALAPSGVYTSLAASTPAHGTVSISGTTATYTPTSGYYGSDSFTYTATGPGGTSAAATVSLTVATPAAPTVAAVSTSTAYNTAKVITLAPSGVYSGLAIAGQPTKGAVSLSGSAATYTPTSGAYGADSFTYTATGPGGTSAPAAVSIAVATPDAPTVSALSASTAYNTAKAIALAPSGIYSSLAVVTAPTKGTVSLSGSTATYTPSSGSYGSDSFTYKAVGPGGDSAAASVSLSIGNPPTPTASDVTQAASYNAATAFNIPSGGDWVSLNIATQPAHGAVQSAWNGTGWTFTYTPNSGYYGPDAFIYNITNPGGSSGNRTVSLTVATPPAPTAANVGLSLLSMTSGQVSLSPAGVYSGASVASGPAHGAVSLSGLTATYMPSGVYVGADSFTYVASGPGGTSAPATVSVTVQNRAPTANSDVADTDLGVTKSIFPLANDTDPEGQALTIVSASASSGSVTVYPTYLSYTPSAVAVMGASYTITYTISDGNGGTATSTVAVTINDTSDQGECHTGPGGTWVCS